MSRKEDGNNTFAHTSRKGWKLMLKISERIEEPLVSGDITQVVSG